MSTASFQKFIREIGADPQVVQGNGGNFSVKDDVKMLIKGSGTRFGDAKIEDLIEIDLQIFRDEFRKETELDATHIEHEHAMNELMRKFSSDNGRASMEAAMHAFLPRYVLHTHLVTSNVILCMTNGEDVLKEVFSDVPYTLVEYATPGFELGALIMKKPPEKITFLQNHGIIVCGDSLKELKNIFELVIKRCTNYLKINITDYSPFTGAEDAGKFNGALFPDAAVYEKNPESPNAKETMSVQTYLEDAIKKLGRSPQYISKEKVKYLQNMDAEKFRQVQV